MKCFRLLLLLFFIPFVSLAQDVVVEPTVHLSPYNDKILVNGDKAFIRVDSKFDDQKLRSFINQRVDDQFYILDFIVNEEGRLYKVFVINPPGQSQMPNIPGAKPQKKKPSIFTLSKDFKFEMDQNRLTKEYLLVETEYKEVIETPWWKYLLWTILIIFFLLFVLKMVIFPYRQKLKRRARKKKRALQIIDQLDHVKSRDDFETIYKMKDELSQLLEFDSTSFKKFLKKLNEIQYKKEWSEEEKKGLEQIYKQIGEVRFKDGV